MAHQLKSGPARWEPGTLGVKPWHADMPKPKFSLKFWLRKRIRAAQSELSERIYQLGDWVGQV